MLRFWGQCRMSTRENNALSRGFFLLPGWHEKNRLDYDVDSTVNTGKKTKWVEHFNHFRLWHWHLCAAAALTPQPGGTDRHPRVQFRLRSPGLSESVKFLYMSEDFSVIKCVLPAGRRTSYSRSGGYGDKSHCCCCATYPGFSWGSPALKEIK